MPNRQAIAKRFNRSEAIYPNFSRSARDFRGWLRACREICSAHGAIAQMPLVQAHRNRRPRQLPALRCAHARSSALGGSGSRQSLDHRSPSPCSSPYAQWGILHVHLRYHPHGQRCGVGAHPAFETHWRHGCAVHHPRHGQLSVELEIIARRVGTKKAAENPAAFFKNRITSSHPWAPR